MDIYIQSIAVLMALKKKKLKNVKSKGTMNLIFSFLLFTFPEQLEQLYMQQVFYSEKNIKLFVYISIKNF